MGCYERPARSVSRQRFADSNTSSIDAPDRRSPFRSCSTWISASSAAATSSGLVAHDFLPDIRGARRQARRVHEAAPAQVQPLRSRASPTTCISALTVSCGRWLMNASR